MKRTLIPIFGVIIVIGALLACSASVRLKEDHYPDRQLKEQWVETRDTTGDYVKHGKFVALYPGGAEQILGEYNQGQKTGLWLTKSETGQLMEWAEYLDGELHGLSVGYYPDRNKKYEGKSAHDFKYGWWRLWHENGMLQEETLYASGQKDSLSTTWFATGQKKEEAHYRDGVLDGPYTTWRESGLRAVQGQFKHGRADGLWTTWDDLGLVLAVEKYDDGQIVTDTTNTVVTAPDSE